MDTLPPEAAAARPEDRYGRYIATSRLGEGGFGEVWKAWDSSLRRWVALKLLRAADGNDLERFTREARTAARLSHPNIAAVYEVGQANGRHFIAMQWIDGPTLKALAGAEPRQGAEWIRDAARAVHAAHASGVIHRDVKPENLMRDGAGRLFVLDFGLAREMKSPHSLTASGMAVGTPSYMSPEQARGSLADARSDVYSLGATLYELVTRRPPFEGATALDLLFAVIEQDPIRPSSLAPALAADLETVILKCLEKEPARRYASAADLADDLDRWLREEPVLARRPTLIYRLNRAFARKRPVAIALSLGAAAVLIVMLVVVPRWMSATEARRRLEEAQKKRNDAMDRARIHVERARRLLESLPVAFRNPRFSDAELDKLLSDACAEFGAALAIVPDHPDALLGLARAHVAAGRRDAALEALGKAIAASPRFATAYLDRVRLDVDEYENLRHTGGGRVRIESPEAAALRARIEADLDAVRRHSTDDVERLFGEGLLAFCKGNYEQAQEVLGRYVARAPLDSRAMLARGHALYHLVRSGEAIRVLLDAAAVDPRDPMMPFYIGLASTDLRDWDTAVSAFTDAMRLDRAFTRAYINRAFALSNRGNSHMLARRDKEAAADWTAALRDLDQADRLEPGRHASITNRATVHRLRGEWHGRNGRRDASIADFDRAIALYTEALKVEVRADTHVNRGASYEGRDDRQAALRDYSEALRLQPDLVESRVARGHLRFQLGDLTGALEDALEAIRARPDLMLPHYTRGLVAFSHARRHEQAGRREEADREFDAALAAFSEATRLDKDYFYAWYQRGNVRNERAEAHDEARRPEDASRERELAVADFDEALRLKPDNAPAHNNRGHALRGLGRLDEAAAEFAAALRADPKHVSSHYNLGNVLKSQGDRLAATDRAAAIEKWSAAIASYDAALEIEPDKPDVLTNRGNAKRQKGEAAGALADYRRALQVAPADWRYRARVEGFVRELEKN